MAGTTSPAMTKGTVIASPPPSCLPRSHSPLQLPGTPWISGKNSSCQVFGRFLIEPTSAMKLAYRIRFSGAGVKDGRGGEGRGVRGAAGQRRDRRVGRGERHCVAVVGGVFGGPEFLDRRLLQDDRGDGALHRRDRDLVVRGKVAQ